MDEAVIDEAVDGAGARAAAAPDAPGAMPPEAPRPMPSQPLSRLDGAVRRAPRARGAARLRAIVLVGALALSAFAAGEMGRALSVGRPTAVSVAVLALFAVNFTWIALPFTTALVGFARSLRRRTPAPGVEAPLATRTALLMPTYNEDPARVAAALEAMARDVVRRGEGRAFDVFVLSDTTRGDVALAEEEAFRALRRRLGGAIGVHYRRRARNVAHKPGNVRDFCERWGGAYDHLVVLDADSLVDGATLVGLARRMEDDPDAGLVQTLPRLHRGATLLARVQQFAGSVYGSLLGEGLAAWAGGEATSWGHNAILRTEAFTESCGLPALPGGPPFGGAIRSHDFVEAALLRRRGWTVTIAPELAGSWEEGPSSLADQEARDRRWCQGNLQHARILPAKGLHWVSRLHLVTGIVSYVASPLWLLFVVAALALGVQYDVAHQQYFALAPSLFPLWPRIDPALALRLFGLTLGILFGPKLLGFLSVALRPRRLRAHGGLARLALGVVVEAVLSAAIAPVLALVHTGLVVDALRGRDSGWRAQRREGESLPWGDAVRRHRRHAVAGAVLAAVAWAISWRMLLWLLPAVVGMLLAAPLAKLLASPAAGRALQRLGLLRIPEEARTPAIARAAEAALPAYREAVRRAPGLADVVRDPALLARHLALVDREPPRASAAVDVVDAVAERKIRVAGSREEAIAALAAEERGRALAHPGLLALLAELPAGRAPGVAAASPRPPPEAPRGAVDLMPGTA